MADKKFRFQGQKFLLTYTHIHIDKEWLINKLTEVINKGPLKFIRVAHETGNATGVEHPHTHVLIDVGKRIDTLDSRKFDVVVENIVQHPNLQPVNTVVHWYNQVAYIAKEDAANADLLEKKNVAVDVWNNENVQDALINNCKKVGDALGVIALFNCKPGKTVDVQIDRPNLPWHLEAIELIESKPDARTIHWFYDPVGNTGKTWLSQWLESTNQAFSMEYTGGHKDFAMMIATAKKNGWDQRCFILDMPRQAENFASIYTSLECVKNGKVTSLKYEGQSVMFNRPHCLVFANFEPDRSKMSADRWRVHKLLPGGILENPIFSSAIQHCDTDSPVETLQQAESLPDELNVISSSQVEERPDNILFDEEEEKEIDEEKIKAIADFLKMI